MTKKILSVLIAIAMVLTFALTAFADPTPSEYAEHVYDGLVYEIVDNEVSIIGYTEDIASDVVIPDNIDGYPVTEIDYHAFFCDGRAGEGEDEGEPGRIKSVLIGNNVKKIRADAFAECMSLERVIISDSVEEIRMYAFSYCPNLKSVTIGKGVKYIGEFAFIISLDANVYYCGTENEWSMIETASNGFPTGLEDATIHYNYVPEPTTEEPTTEEPTTDEPTTEEPDSELETKVDSEIVADSDDNIVTAPTGTSAEAFAQQVENDNIKILSADGNELAYTDLVGTGCKVQVTDNEGNVLSEYEVIVKSDVNGDAKITAADARLTLRASAGLDSLEGVYAIAANANSDEKLTAADARLILRKSAGLE